MSFMEVANLRKAFDAQTFAVDDLSFSVDRGEILVIVGASGCGKTTTLRCIAGLEMPTSGSISIDGLTVVGHGQFVPPEKRGIGMVFQSYALWPHKTVAENIAYGLTMRGDSASSVREAVGRALAMVGLQGMGGRYPSTLSGGQQQRVALARSAIAEPKVLLLDEPLSNLDAKLREQMRIELRRLIKSLRMTAVHITHDQSEAMAIADKIIYMRNGRIEQQGSPRELYRAPASRAVAEFVGSATFVDGRVVGSDGGDLRVEAAGNLEILARPVPGRTADASVTIAIRPEAVSLAASRPQGRNVFPGKVLEESFLGGHTQYLVDVAGQKLTCLDRADFEPGADVFVVIPPKEVICLPRATV
jgi:ABC-type Fe3+/spermidine/putrescine transport system ATPase subunit